MKNKEKLNNIHVRVRLQPNIKIPLRAALTTLILPLIITGCATEAEFLAQNAPSE